MMSYRNWGRHIFGAAVENRRIAIGLASITFLLFCYPSLSFAGRTKVGLGAGIFYGGGDFIVSYQPNDGPWVYNFRHGYSEEKDDEFGPVVKQGLTWTGPVVDYLFTPKEAGSFYASAGVFDFTMDFTTESLQGGVTVKETDSDSATEFVIGGGYTRWFKKDMYGDIGVFFGLGRQLHVATSVASTDTTAAAARLIIGMGF